MLILRTMDDKQSETRMQIHICIGDFNLKIIALCELCAVPTMPKCTSMALIASIAIITTRTQQQTIYVGQLYLKYI